jgi:serine/threonine-protein phosphatase Stp1
VSENIRIQAASLTHQGLVRKANEDSILQRDDIGLWIVADGMGGHQGGKFASSAVVEALSGIELDHDGEGLLSGVQRAIGAANTAIYEASQDGRRMGTTIVGLTLDDTCFTCFWAGDSRAYLLRDAKLYRLTKDHTRVQDMVDSGLLTSEEAASHPMAHVLSRAIGVEEQVQLGTVRDVLLANDVFFLCSDGVHGVVKDSELTETLLHRGPAGACKELLELVLKRGAPDNASMIVVACQQATAIAIPLDQ